MTFYSPLRYPGGKSQLTNFLGDIIDLNNLQGGHYVEPYAGGAGAALSLLNSGKVSQIYINDLDKAIYAFWFSVFNNTDEMVSLIKQCPVTVDEWKKQREILKTEKKNLLKLGFSAFFLNRTSRSGILQGSGVIGGYDQTGKYKIDARYYKDTMIKRIKALFKLKDSIHLYNLDAIDFLKEIIDLPIEETLIYFDPPYYVKGQRLYQNNYEPDDHKNVADFLQKKVKQKWVLSYDDVPQIRRLYQNCSALEMSLNYTAAKRYKGKEILFFSKDLKIPTS